MRQVLSVSFPQHLVKEVKKIAKERGFDSVSSYIKQLIEMDKGLISETELLKTIKQSREDHKAGKSLAANSISELI